jgi:hypothetical protein
MLKARDGFAIRKLATPESVAPGDECKEQRNYGFDEHIHCDN